MSKRCYIGYGVPQGSVLGPLCYVILTNDLVKQLKYCHSIIFADDTTIYISGKNTKFLRNKLLEDLNAIQRYFDTNRLTLNKDKTQFMIVKPKNVVVPNNFNLEIGGVKLQLVQYSKFLGVIIDEQLNWNTR